MSDMVLNKEECFNALPPEWGDDLLPSIRERVKKSRSKIVVLDDDPTGTQTVHGLPVLTTWAEDDLRRELKGEAHAFYILTNSRGLPDAGARALAAELGSNLKRASEATGVGVSMISRSDSTLRGHFPYEVDEAAKALGIEGLPYLVCPFFLEGGRFTIDDVHYVAEGERLVPAARTSFADDAAFGFTHSNLRQWIEEKTKGAIPADAVVSISLDHIRRGGPARVTDILMEAPDNGACIVNAVSYRDMEVLVSGLLDARENGKRFLYRTAASFVRVRAGVTPREEFLSKNELASETSAGGLFIVGSYVPRTTAQVSELLNRTNIVPIQVNVGNVLDERFRDNEIESARARVGAALKNGEDALIYTSRKLAAGDDPESSLKIGQAVSASLIEIVKGLTRQPRWLVAKGGITSSDVATRGLNVKKAQVLGQVLPGVPVWKLGEESRFPGMSYIIFPGNVGRDDDLVVIQRKLRISERECQMKSPMPKGRIESTNL